LIREALQPLYAFSAGQACGHLEVIAQFGRFPHRNAILGRASTAEEERYMRAATFRPPAPRAWDA
jgi:uncharacterized protein (DUF924 family)